MRKAVFPKGGLKQLKGLLPLPLPSNPQIVLRPSAHTRKADVLIPGQFMVNGLKCLGTSEGTGRR